jgi:hypothetical protein
MKAELNKLPLGWRPPTDRMCVNPGVQMNFAPVCRNLTLELISGQSFVNFKINNDYL